MTDKELRKKGKLLKPILSIGKNGVNKGSLDLIDRELKQKELIKIKILRSAKETSKEDIIAHIASATKAMIIEKIGNVVVLYRKK